MARFGSMLTDIGIAAIANAVILEGKVDIAKFAVGDGAGGYYMPTSSMTALKRECWRGNIASSEIDKTSPNVIKVTAILPSSVGGFTVREVGLFTTDNKMLAIGNMPDTEKIIITEGAAAEVVITMQIAVSNTDVVNITVDPTVVIATKADIQRHNISPLAHADIRQEIMKRPKLVIIPQNSDIPIADRTSNTVYLKITDTQSGGGGLPQSIKVSPNMGLKLSQNRLKRSKSGISFE